MKAQLTALLIGQGALMGALAWWYVTLHRWHQYLHHWHDLLEARGVFKQGGLSDRFE